ncbi:hypothetical protein BJX65DRAFT_158264 [Aspergillus insuetus]
MSRLSITLLCPFSHSLLWRQTRQPTDSLALYLYTPPILVYIHTYITFIASRANFLAFGLLSTVTLFVILYISLLTRCIVVYIVLS